MENRQIPEGLWATPLTGISTEGLEALRKVQPENLGQASRVRGISPADIGVLMVRLEEFRQRRAVKDGPEEPIAAPVTDPGNG
jgi:tRNA uridine 5-carboxymethylaminomethyl modification enzyme